MLHTTNHDGKFRRFVNWTPVPHSGTFRGTAFLVLAAALVMALAAGAMLHADEPGQTIVPYQSADDTGLIQDLAAFAPLPGYAFAQTPPDDTPPTFVSSGLDLTARNLTITFSEAIDVTPATNVVPTGIHIRESGNYTHGVTLTAGELGTTADGATISFTLNDAHLAAVAVMGKQELTIEPGAVRDTSGNLIVGTFDASTRTFVDATSIKSQERAPTGMAFSSDGTKMFVIGDSRNAVNEYALSAPFDVSTRSFIDSVSVVVHDIIPTGIAFSNDGTRLFMIGISLDSVNEYRLPTPFAFSAGCNPWNACTFTGGRTIPPHFPERPDATFVDATSIRSQEVDPRGMAFSSNGTKMFVIGIAGKDVNEYTLSAPFDASTRTFVDATSISEQETIPTGIAFSSDGTKMFVIGDEGDDVNEYTLSAPFDASTRTFVDATSVSEQETVPTDIAFSNDGAKMFVLGTRDNVNEYDLSSVYPIEVTGAASQSLLTSESQQASQSQQASAATLDPVGTPGPRDIGRIILTSTTPGTIEASWVAPSEAPANYRISWAKVGDPYLTWTDSTGNAFPTDPAHTITGLEAGETYNVKVRASYSGTAGDWSGDVTITIAEVVTNTIAEVVTNTIAEAATDTIAVPGTPVNIGVSPGSSGTLDVSWQAPAFDGGSSITGYTVQWKAASGDWTVPSDVSEAATTGTSHTITGLTDGTTYAVRVFATNSIGDGVPSAESMVTQQTPQQPLGSRDIGRIILTSTTPGTIEAIWVAPSEAPANYRISWAKVGDPYLTWTDSAGNAFPTDPSHAITGLEAGETYKVKVRASYSGTSGDWSDGVTVTTTKTFHPFITTWQTTAAGESITIPVGDATGIYTIDWGDGNVNYDVSGDQGHTYDDAGTYTVRISGDFARIYLNGQQPNADKLQSIEQWGDVRWESMRSAFQGASSMEYHATDTPDLSGVTAMRYMFEGAASFNGDLSDWDVSSVTDMSHMFRNAASFNGDISAWDVSSVTDMSHMFRNAASFSGDISAWDVSSVTDMRGLFYDAGSFNGDISAWDVSSVTDMSHMFRNAAPFNANLSAWDVSLVTNMTAMFEYAGAFNSNISAWDVSSVTDTSYMFDGAVSFNQPINSWNVSAVTDMAFMLIDAESFAQNLGDWYIMLDDTSISSANETLPISAQNAYLDGQNPTYAVDDPRFVVTGGALSIKSGLSVPPGSYEVNVTSTGDFGQGNSKKVEISVDIAQANSPPSVDAGEPVAVREGAQVTLNATASDQDGDQLTYSWNHDSTLDISMANADSLSPTFTAPQVSANTTVAFMLTADDGTDTRSDTVIVTILDVPAVSTVVTDTTAPTISSIERANPSSATTDSQTLVYRITFSEDVTGVDTADFALSSDSTGDTNGNNPVTSVSGSGDTYYATVSATTDGTYNLDLVSSGHGIADTASNPLANTAPTGADETYTVSTTVVNTANPRLESIERYSPTSQNTNAQDLIYKATFSKSVTGVGASDFVLSPGSTGGGNNGSSPIDGISGSGDTYYVIVSPAVDGTYNLDLVSSGHNIADAASNPLTNTTPTGADETYTVS